MKPDMYFRTDGSSHIGLGHLVRCISLSSALKTIFNIHFVSRQIPYSIEEELKSHSFIVSKISDEEEFMPRIKYGDYVVLDGYHFDVDYQKKIKSLGCYLVCIDDLHNQKFVADLIINHSPCVSEDQYEAKPYTRFTLGPDYTLIRPSFLNYTGRQSEPDPSTILICFGGSDSENLTMKAYNVIKNFPEFKKITIITGSAYQEKNVLIRLISTDKRVNYLEAVGEEQMAENMRNAHVAIIPASGILFEAIASGTIPLSGMYTDNQRNVYSGFKKLNAFIDAGTFKEHEIEQAIEKIPHFKKQNIIDGKSPERFRQLFSSIISETN